MSRGVHRAWGVAGVTFAVLLAAAAFASSMGSGNFGGALAPRYSCSHFTSARNSALSLGGAPSTPSAESITTE